MKVSPIILLYFVLSGYIIQAQSLTDLSPGTAYPQNYYTGRSVLSTAANKGPLTDDYPISPVSFTSILLADSFWLPRINIIHDVTIPHALTQSADRIMNFRIAAGLDAGAFQSQYPFDDSDIYKIIEAASYSLYYNPDPALEEKIDSIIKIIGLAQEPDGYLYTARKFTSFPTGFPTNWLGSTRWEKENDLSHETYNMGHLFEAACAYYQATGKDELLQIAIKAADLLDQTFGWGKLETYPGHQIVEVGLARLYRLTGEKKYLDLARFFLDVRGPGGPEYSQAHLKVTDQTRAVGHSVRAAYMYAGMADIAALLNDDSYISAIDKIWEDIVTKKIYVTGGIGASGGNEGFSDDYNLPNSSAYCETCASIGNIYMNHRLFLLTGNARYIDVLERTLYNSLLSGISLSGDRFFYPNRLSSAGTTTRSVWFGCACCPPNIAKLIPSVPGYIYAHKSDTLFINLYMSDTATFVFNGNNMQVIQNTGYPWDGSVNIEINPGSSTEFTMMVRIPGWARNEPIYGDLYQFADTSASSALISVNGVSTPYNLKNGYAVISRTWSAGDKLMLNIPMEPRKLLAHEQILDNRNRFAVQRGPIVFCAEGSDNGETVDAFKYQKSAVLSSHYEQNLLGGTQVVTLDKENGEEGTADDVTLIPYSLWSNRGASKMQVWLSFTRSITHPDSLILIEDGSFATTNYVSSWEDLNSIHDLYDPVTSSDKGPGAFGNWAGDRSTVGVWNWVQYNFQEITTISSTEVYWWRDGAGINIPDSSFLSYYDAGLSKHVKIASTMKWGADIVANQYNKEVFPPVQTKGIRLNFFDKTMAQGILEWKVYKPATLVAVSDLKGPMFSVNIFPNPSANDAYVEVSATDVAEIFIFSSTGQLVYRSLFNKVITISRSVVRGSGIYFAKIVINGQTHTKKFIVL